MTKCQNTLEYAINTTLVDLTAQLHQLTQLMTSPALTPAVALPPIPMSSSPVSPPSPVEAILSIGAERPTIL